MSYVQYNIQHSNLLASGQSLNISANMDPHIIPYLEDLVSRYTFVSAAWGLALNGANV